MMSGIASSLTRIPLTAGLASAWVIKMPASRLMGASNSNLGAYRDLEAAYASFYATLIDGQSSTALFHVY